MDFINGKPENINIKFKAFSLMANAVVVFAIAIGFLYQQRAIKELRQELLSYKALQDSYSAINPYAANGTIAGQAGMESTNTTSLEKNSEQLGIAKEILGEITEKQDKQIKVKDMILDANRDVQIDAKGMFAREDVFIVNINDKTELMDLKMSELQVGRSVRILYSQPHNNENVINAIRIMAPPLALKELLAAGSGQTVIGGTVQRNGQDNLIVISYGPDHETKKYTVNIGKNTKLIKFSKPVESLRNNAFEQTQISIKAEDIKVNDHLMIFTATTDRPEIEADRIAVIAL